MLTLASSAEAHAASAVDMFSLAPLFTFNGIFSVLMLIAVETVLGIDNVIYQTLSAKKLPTEAERKRAMYYGFALGVIIRIVLLAGIAVLRSHLTSEVFGFTFNGKEISITWAGLIMIGGGLFLTWQSAKHLFHFVEVKEHKASKDGKVVTTITMGAVMLEMLPINVVFSLDSVFTAQGMTDTFWGMCIAILAQTAIMIFCSKGITHFMNKHESFNILALAFLLVIGFHLVCEGFHYEIPKFFVYGLGAFALAMELLEIRRNKNKARFNGATVH